MMKKAVLGVIASSTMLFSSAAFAEPKWIYASMSTSNSVWYVDLDSIKPISDGYRSTAKKAWIKIDYSLDKTEVAREVKQLVYFKCDEEIARTVSVVKYKSDGSVMQSYSLAYSQYSPVVPETVLHGVMDLVCAAEQ